MGMIVNLRHWEERGHGSMGWLKSPARLIKELELYRDKTQRLARKYDLHRKLADKLDLESMLEAISLWLHGEATHELVGFRHQRRKRRHLVCSQHGPNRQDLEGVASETLDEAMGSVYAGGSYQRDGLCYHVLPLEPESGDGHLLFVHHESDCSPKRFRTLIHDMADEIRAPLARAMDYEDLYEQARCDSLTGLVNRRVFEERAEQEMRNADRYGHDLSVAGLDLDHFKAVNDRLGHAAGDDALIAVAQAMGEMVRESDLLARVGGDEFILLMPNTDAESARHILNRLCERVQEMGIQAPGAPALGVSIGVSAWEKGLDLKGWMEKTDAALYRAKAQGRSRVAA